VKPRILAVIPARGGSRGLPGKNIRPFVGLPLIEHSIRFAKLCPALSRCVVSTDSDEIAAVARSAGAEIPFLRPAEIAQAETPMWPVLRHALAECERVDGPYDLLCLLDPTSPTRLPQDLDAALELLARHPQARGAVAASKPEFNPVWHCVVEKDGWMADFVPGGGRIARRQDAPEVYRINGLLYVWRAAFVRESDSWRREEPHRLVETPDLRAVSIDDLDQFRRAEALVSAGLIKLPWLEARIA
jgi:CMP-N,N'-diacetyllegionaminic acid synthase